MREPDLLLLLMKEDRRSEARNCIDRLRFADNEVLSVLKAGVLSDCTSWPSCTGEPVALITIYAAQVNYKPSELTSPSAYISGRTPRSVHSLERYILSQQTCRASIASLPVAIVASTTSREVFTSLHSVVTASKT